MRRSVPVSTFDAPHLFSIACWRCVRISGLCLILMFVAACGPPVAVQPTPVAAIATDIAPSPTEQIPTATSTPEPAPTLEPTPTPGATPTLEPAPTEVALQPFDAALAAELQRILDGTVADGYIPGAVLAVSIPGQEAWRGASGFADPRHQQPM